MKKRRILSAFLVVVLAVSLASCAAPAQTPAAPTAPAAPGDQIPDVPGEPIRIASIVPLTGPQAQNGESLMNSVNLRVRLFNEAGGYNGRPVEITFFDDRQDPRETVSVAQMIVSDGGFIGILGPFSSASGLAISGIIEEHRIPMYAFSASHEDFVAMSEFNMTQTALMPRSRQVEAEHVFERGIRRAAYIFLNDDTGLVANRHFSYHFERLGGEMVLSESFLADQIDYTALITMAIHAGAESINSFANYSQGITLIRQARELGFEGPIFFAGNTQQQEVIDVLGEIAERGEGVFFISQFSPDYPTEGVRQFVELYSAEYGGRIPAQICYQAWEATGHFLQALTELGPDDPAALAAFMRNNPAATSVFGTVPYFDGTPHAPLPIVTIRDGQFVTYA